MSLTGRMKGRRTNLIQSFSIADTTIFKGSSLFLVSISSGRVREAIGIKVTNSYVFTLKIGM